MRVASPARARRGWELLRQDGQDDGDGSSRPHRGDGDGSFAAVTTGDGGGWRDVT